MVAADAGEPQPHGVAPDRRLTIALLIIGFFVAALGGWIDILPG